MAEWQLLELQLGQLIQLVAARRQEVVDEDAEEVEDGCQAFSLFTWALCTIMTHLLGILERSVSCLERA